MINHFYKSASTQYVVTKINYNKQFNSKTYYNFNSNLVYIYIIY